jgi:transglutaminase-like putative cysteine protease
MHRILRHRLWVLGLLAVACQLPPGAEGLPTRSFELEFTVVLPEAAADAVVWVPVPLEDGAQTVEILEQPAGSVISAPDRHGNRYASVTAPQATEYTWRYRVVRSTDVAGVTSWGDAAGYLGADRLVPVDGESAARAAEASAGARGTGAVTRALYDRVLGDMRYDKSGEGWGTGSTDWACRQGYGNCTDFHALFISMSRSRAIPARFTIGFALPAEGEVKGYHCWAHFWDEARGWTPVDISEADKDPSRTEFFYGTLDPDRVSMTVGRDLALDPPQQAGPVNYLVRAYAEKGGKPWAVRTVVHVRG